MKHVSISVSDAMASSKLLGPFFARATQKSPWGIACSQTTRVF
jgi:hypothetical protein